MARKKDLDSLHCFWAHVEAPPGVPWAKLAWSAATGRYAGARKSCSRSSGAMTFARAVPDAGFKKCCMRSGEYDGSDRHYYRRS